MALADQSEWRGIGAIGEACGFRNNTTFSRAFRHAYGYAPREVREARSSVFASRAVLGSARPKGDVFLDWIQGLRLPRIIA
jgi:AraC-like DNA-binding protein